MKIRGFRIELGEIEATLESHPDVAEAVVVAREDVPGEKRLIAYVVPTAPSGLIDVTLLRESLQAALPRFMVPAQMLVMHELPRTPNGKVDRARLPRLLIAAEARERHPPSPLENEIIAVWEDVLGTVPVSPADDFFALGGDSLLALRMIAELRQRLDREIPLRAVFEAPNIAALAAAIECSARSIP